ncbi:MAG: hypothetical protein ACOZAA_16060 [Pseudomonadota bacterium]
MRIRNYSRYLEAGIAGFAVFWLAIPPATAETSTAADTTQAEEQKKSADADKNCDCPCMTESKEAKKKRVIYVGPRQNIPFEIDEN